MYQLNRQHSVYSFSKHHEPALRVESGARVHFQTFDCFTDQIQSEADLVSNIDFARVNPATGPVYVTGATPGSVLKVEIHDVRVRDWGVIATLPGIGVLAHTVDHMQTKIVAVKDSRVAYFNDRIHFHVDPMIGVIGVAPAGDEVACGHPGDHGGNIDTHVITRGSTVYFPVQVEGALFGLGDVHAAMGDGEICGTGIEIAGEVEATLSVLHGDLMIQRPLVETVDAWYTVASAPDLPTAITRCSEDMQRLLAAKWELTNERDVFPHVCRRRRAEMCQCC